MSLQVLLSVGAGVNLQPDVQAGVERAVRPPVTPTEEVKLPAALQDDWSQGQKDALGLDTLERQVRTRWKESQKLKSHWEPSKIIKREINNAWHKKWQGYNLNENIWNRTKDTKSWKYVKYLLRFPQIKNKTYRRNSRNKPRDILEYSDRGLLRNCHFPLRYDSFAGDYI